MTESMTTPWQGDWQLRLRSKLASLGFDALDEYLSANPAIGYVRLAESLGDANVAAMQLYGLQIRIAVDEGYLRDAAKDCLVRFLNEYVKRGWGNGKHFATRVASAFATWSTTITTNSNDDTVSVKLKNVFDELQNLKPESGWLPKGKNDKLLEQAFEKGWPEVE